LAYSSRLLAAAAVPLAALAAAKLGSEFWRLLVDPSWRGAVDLAMRQREVQAFFAGEALYEVAGSAVYPPGSLLLLWPLVGWLSGDGARELFALVALLGLAALAREALLLSQARGKAEGAFVALLPLSLNATGVAVGNGQLGILVLPALLAAARLIESRRHPLLAGLLLTFSLVKVSLSVPFLLLTAALRGGGRVTAAAAAGYAVLTLAAIAWNGGAFLDTPLAWHRAAIGAASVAGYAHLPGLLTSLGLWGRWTSAGSAACLLALAAWLWRRPAVEPFVKLGVTGLVARLCSYHWRYDDVVVAPALVALFRLGRDGPDRGWARLLLAANLLLMLLPARLVQREAPTYDLLATGHAVVWLASLGLLLRPRGPQLTGRAAARTGTPAHRDAAGSCFSP
jgi:hypothetical protein